MTFDPSLRPAAKLGANKKSLTLNPQDTMFFFILNLIEDKQRMQKFTASAANTGMVILKDVCS